MRTIPEQTACRQFIESAVTSLLDAETDAAEGSLQRWLQLECDLPQRWVFWSVGADPLNIAQKRKILAMTSLIAHSMSTSNCIT